MRKALVAVAAVTVLAAPAASRAQEGAPESAPESAAQAAPESASHAPEAAKEHGLQVKLGLGAGYGLPMGDMKKDGKLSDLYSGEIPIELEASYKFTHAISAGLYAGYGLGLVSSKSSEVDSIASWRFGVQGEYEFGKVGPAVPFTTLRVGYVTESIALKLGGTDKASGWEYLTLIGGADFEVSESFAVGPFVSLSLGQYTTEKNDGFFATESIPSAERAFHEWLTIGLRGAFTL